MKKVKAIRYAIVGLNGLYIGQHIGRADMIAQHVSQLCFDSTGNEMSQWPEDRHLTNEQRIAWKRRRLEGDRCIRVEIRELKPRGKAK